MNYDPNLDLGSWSLVNWAIAPTILVSIDLMKFKPPILDKHRMRLFFSKPKRISMDKIRWIASQEIDIDIFTVSKIDSRLFEYKIKFLDSNQIVVLSDEFRYMLY